MKKKFFIGIAMSLFAVATVFNMNISDQNDASDVSLNAITVMAKATGEGVPDPCDEIWDVEYSASVGTSTGGTVTCSTGGEYKCPICIW